MPFRYLPDARRRSIGGHNMVLLVITEQVAFCETKN